MSNLELNHVYKVYPNGVKAVNDFTMKIDDKEFIVFVGPSGCGKSTTLRMIAGLEEISSGEIKLDGLVINDAEPKERDIAMVFQNYALYPHMTVYKNMAFGLKLRHMPKDEIDAKVKDVAEILGLTEYLDRKPKAMSGGQRQRVALGRAIVREPKVFLLDEPLSNLDAKLRAQMRSQISKLHERLQTTFIYVTHDQVEAMTMGTRIVVMKDGFVQQIDTPRNLYRYPANKFVAGFIGTPQMNFLTVRLTKEKDEVTISFQGVDLSIKAPIDLFSRVNPSYLDGTKDVCFGLRSEHISTDLSKYPFKAKCRISHIEDLGVDAQVYADLNVDKEDLIGDSATKIIFRAATGFERPEDGIVEVSMSLSHMHLFDIDDEKSISPLLPSSIHTKGTVKKGALSIYGANMSLPNALSSLSEGEYDIDIPTDSLKVGGKLKTKISAISMATDKKVLTLKSGSQYLFLEESLSNKREIGEEVMISVDLKRLTFRKGGEEFLPMVLDNSIAGKVIKGSKMVPHTDKNGKEKSIKEYYCEIKIGESSLFADAETGFKIINLLDSKAFKDEIELHFDPYSAPIMENGAIAGVVTNTFDYGAEKFVEIQYLGDSKAIVLDNAGLKIGDEARFSIDLSKASAYNAKNGIRLL